MEGVGQIIPFQLLFLIPGFPLLGFVLVLAFRERLGRAVSVIAPGVVGLAFLAAAAAFYRLLGSGPGAVLTQRLYTWISAGDFNANIALRFDPLSAVMALVVTGVGFLIHVYSAGYMGHDECKPRYFAYLNLFTFAMLLLVLADDLLLLFVGWEGVGLCSYLLIGFWFEKEENASAGKKAFIVNRVGDAGFVLGLLLLLWSLGAERMSLGVGALKEIAPSLDAGTVTVATLLLFVGATGKSAQLPLYVWLPDAMAGPTPVSALIHAATMVTAGIYMIARLSFLFALAPITLAVVAWIGILTALFAATIALAQNDIKKVLAYSTISQLGYMFASLGVGAFSSGIFHLMTHAFFKALLFLGAGSVIHALGGEQDIRRMGGLREHMPVTFWTFLIATLAISGIPLLSGFFSKDQILERAFASGHIGVWAVGLAAAGLTAFYMFRLLFLTFFGELRAAEQARRHLHESPPVMTVPLVALGILAAVGGYVGLPEGVGWGDKFGEFLHGVLVSFAGHHLAAGTQILLTGCSVGVALLGLLVAYFCYIVQPGLPVLVAYRLSGLYKVLAGKYFVDEAYDLVIVRPYFKLANLAWRIFDVGIVDGAVNGAATMVSVNSELWRRLQTGRVQNYAFSFLGGAVALLAALYLAGRG